MNRVGYGPAVECSDRHGTVRSGPGPLAAVVLSRRFLGVRFGPLRHDEFPVILCVCAWVLLSLLAYLIFS
jgi:hypothetical protein